MTKPAPNRRERIRDATLIEIRTVARELLVRHGSSAVKINAVAREMRMSGPALYRYYASHEELVSAVTTDFYQELGTLMEKARYARPQDAAAQRLLAMCRSTRGSVTKHPTESGWMFP